MGPRERRLLGVLVLCCLSACLYDADDRCGEHQEYVHGICVCADGYVQKGSACEEVPAPTDAGSTSDEEGGMAPSDGGRAPYTGQKAPCTDHASCAGFDAKYCNPVVHTCLVRDCTETSCDPGYMCIDLGMYIPGEPKVCLDPADFPR
jgi:hypothetical protein